MTDAGRAARSAKLRRVFARVVARRAGAGDAVERAFAAVPREPFAGPHGKRSRPLLQSTALPDRDPL